jgi:hypothetical protein
MQNKKAKAILGDSNPTQLDKTMSQQHKAELSDEELHGVTGGTGIQVDHIKPKQIANVKWSE